MFTASDILLGAVLPAIICGLVVGVTRWCCATRSGVAAAAGVAAGYIAGHIAVTGWPGWPPATAEQWLVYAAAVSAAVGWVESLRRTPVWLGWTLRMAAVAALLWVTLRPIMRYEWGPSESAAWLVGLGGAALLLWCAVSELAERERGPMMPVAWVMVGAAAAVACMLSGSLKLGQMSGALAAALVGLVVAGLGGGLGVGRGGAAVFVVLLVGLALNAHFYAELSLWGAALLAATPAAVWVGRWGPVQSMWGWRSATVTLLVVGLLLLIVMAPLLVRLAMESGGGDYGDYGY